MEIIILGISTTSDYTITSTVVCKGYKYVSVSEVFNVSLLFKFHVGANKKFGVNSDIISTEDVLLLCCSIATVSVIITNGNKSQNLKYIM